MKQHGVSFHSGDDVLMSKRERPTKKPSKSRTSLERPQKKEFIRKGVFTVYILECSDGSFYTGHTHDLKARLELHEKGRGAKYVRSRKPFKLIYTKAYRYFRCAFLEELRIQALSRKEKEALILGVVKKKVTQQEHVIC
jgi:putative endonuclease